jgi:conjugative transfer region lipoprotein (TIGR03751 family)
MDSNSLNDLTGRLTGRPAFQIALAAGGIALITGLLLSGCSVAGPRHSPIVEATQNSPTVLDIYRGQTTGESGADGAATPGDAKRQAPRDLLHSQSRIRAVAVGDSDTQRYWSALEPMNQRFARVPNPDLVMVVFPHLSKGKYPVPGYVTTFPMYETAQYALPGEVQQDLMDGRAAYDGAHDGQQDQQEGR